MKKTVYVCRGIAGSGKSTMVLERVHAILEAGGDAAVCSSDFFFYCPETGEYKFSRDKLGEAHARCRADFDAAIAHGHTNIFVDNTNVTARECAHYVRGAIDNGYKVVFLEPQTPWAFDVDELTRRNTHGVPREGIERMLARWQPDMTVEMALAAITQEGKPTPDEEAASVLAEV